MFQTYPRHLRSKVRCLVRSKAFFESMFALLYFSDPLDGRISFFLRPSIALLSTIFFHIFIFNPAKRRLYQWHHVQSLSKKCIGSLYQATGYSSGRANLAATLPFDENICARLTYYLIFLYDMDRSQAPIGASSRASTACP